MNRLTILLLVLLVAIGLLVTSAVLTTNLLAFSSAESDPAANRGNAKPTTPDTNARGPRPFPALEWGEWKLLDKLNEGWAQTDTGDVIKVDGQYKMWYGVHGNGFGVDGEWKICYATSPDGIRWKPHGVVMSLSDKVDSTTNTGCGDPAVLYFGGKYRMWYIWKLKGGYTMKNRKPDPARQWQIGYATSPDGVDWTDHTDQLSFHPSMKNSFFKATHGLEGRIYYVNDSTLWMYYNKKFNADGTFRSVSHDGGLTWGPESAEMKEIHRCWKVFWHNGSLHILYSRFEDEPGSIRIADSTDGLNWTNSRVFFAGKHWDDSDALFPVRAKQDFPCGLCQGLDITSDRWGLLVKKLTRAGGERHRMGIVLGRMKEGEVAGGE
ncbi:MAG: hypothetical protein JW818_15975 [Pirellulales bacterium]|nr:hypothetical protein [Pirellulales bacterium]